MGFFGTLFGTSVGVSAIDAVGNAIDKVFTNDEERMQGKAVFEKLRQQPDILQAEINKVAASHKSIFVSGWRSWIGWLCGLGLAYDVFLMPILNGFGFNFPPIQRDVVYTVMTALLGCRAVGAVKKAVKRNNY